MFSLEPLGEIEDLRSIADSTYSIGKVRRDRSRLGVPAGRTRPSDPLVGDLRGSETTDQGIGAHSVGG
jgi:hypothetical protein